MTPEFENMTKAQKFEAIREILVGANADTALIDAVDNELDLIAKKAENAKARQAKKKEEGDELRARVLECLNDDPKSAADVLDILGEEDLTVAMVRARLSQLVTYGQAAKDTAKGEDGKKVVVYTLATETTDAE